MDDKIIATFCVCVCVGRRFQSGEGWHSSENPVCFWNP